MLLGWNLVSQWVHEHCKAVPLGRRGWGVNLTGHRDLVTTIYWYRYFQKATTRHAIGFLPMIFQVIRIWLSFDSLQTGCLATDETGSIDATYPEAVLSVFTRLWLKLWWNSVPKTIMNHCSTIINHQLTINQSSISHSWSLICVVK